MDWCFKKLKMLVLGFVLAVCLVFNSSVLATELSNGDLSFTINDSNGIVTQASIGSIDVFNSCSDSWTFRSFIKNGEFSIKDESSYSLISEGALVEFAVLDESNANYNNHSGQGISAENYYNNQYPTDECTLLRFDTGSFAVPDGRNITSAKLRLYYKWTGGGPTPATSLSVYECNRDWVATEVTWNNYADGQSWESVGARGNNDRGSAVSSYLFSSSTPYGWIEFDVTSVVQGWYSGADNNGFLIDYYSEWGNKRGFHSPDYTGDVSLRPELIVNYEPILVVKNDKDESGLIRDACKSEDVVLNESSPDTNQHVWPTVTSITVENYLNNLYSTDECSLLRFDLHKKWVPEGVGVNSAKLRLYYKWYGGGPVSQSNFCVYKCLRPWDAMNATWNQYDDDSNWQVPGARGANDRGNVLDSVVIDSSTSYGWIELDVTDAVEDWYENNETNNGFVLDYYPNWGNKIAFCATQATSGYGDREWRPELVVEFDSSIWMQDSWNAYENQDSAITSQSTSNGVKYNVNNVELTKHNISVEKEYYWESDRLVKKIKITNNDDVGYFIQTDSDTDLNLTFRNGGKYYVPTHDYVDADGITQECKIVSKAFYECNNQCIALINDDVVASNFISRVDGMFNLWTDRTWPSYYTTDGWKYTSYVDFIEAGSSHEYEISYWIFDGQASKLIRHYNESEDVKAIRDNVWSETDCPEWFDEVCLTGFIEWDSSLIADANTVVDRIDRFSNALPGKWLIVHLSHVVDPDNQLPYSLPSPPTEGDIDWAENELPVIQSDLPNVKLGNYTMFCWVMDENSDEMQAHPDWQVHDEYGNPRYFEPYRACRQPAIPEASDYCVAAHQKWNESVPEDFIYIDGGDGMNAQRKLDWGANPTEPESNYISQWYDWHNLYTNLIYWWAHKDYTSPEVVFGNGNNLSSADINLCEITDKTDLWNDADNWRIVSDKSEFYKLCEPVHGYCSIYLWDSDTDKQYQNIVLSRGLLPNLTRSDGYDDAFGPKRLGAIRNAYKLRDWKLVYPEVLPDWREDGGVIETLMIAKDDHYRLSVINHGSSTSNAVVSFDPEVLGLEDGGKLNMVELKNVSHGVFSVINRWDEYVGYGNRISITLTNLESDELRIVSFSPYYGKITLDASSNYGYGSIEQGDTVSEDIRIIENSPNTAFNTWTNKQAMPIRWSPAYPDSDNTSLLRFDVSSVNIPDSNEIESASLKLYYKWEDSLGIGGWEVSVWKCLKPWDATAATWNNYDAGAAWEIPGAEGKTDREWTPLDTQLVGDSVAPAGPYGWYEWDVTDAVVDWVEGGADNNGFVVNYDPLIRDLYGIQSGKPKAFHGSIYSTTPSLRPKLEIYYRPVRMPSKVVKLFPSDSTDGCSVNMKLKWERAAYADEYKVYLGDSLSAVENANTSSSEYKGSVDADDIKLFTYDPGELTNDKAYYWRIDSVNSCGTEKGDTFLFTTSSEPTKATLPQPVNSQTLTSSINVLGWNAGDNCLMQNVYVGTSSQSVSSADIDSSEFVGVVSAENFYIDWLEPNTTYYWRIDSIGNGGTVKGDIWCFTTAN